MPTPKGAPPLRRLSDAEILDMVRSGRYRVCTTTGRLFGLKGREIKPFEGNRQQKGRYFFRIYGNGGRRGISRSRLVWMVGAGCPVPDGWEVHHRDENRHTDGFDNLICLHKLDHKKLHYGSDAAMEIPD